MKKRCIFSSHGPPAGGPYSHAVAAGNLLFVSGQVPMTDEGVKKGTFEEEARLALSNLQKVLEDAGSGLEHVVKVHAYLFDINDFGKFNEVYKEFFKSDYPARTCIQAGRLPLDVQVEVDAIAIIPDK